MEAIIVALITGGLSLMGVVLSVNSGNSKTRAMIEKNQAVQEERIAALTEEVKRHNSFAERIPRIEERMNYIDDRVRRLEGDA